MALMRSLDASQRRVHMRLFVLRMLGVRRDVLPTPPDGIRNVLFVCHGNIMRSPMAEACLRALASGPNSPRAIESSSAGIFAAIGRGGDARAVEVSAAMGVPLHNHSVRQLSKNDIARADLVCVMDSFNETVCVARYPQAEGKIVLLGAFGREGGEPIEILDPYMGNIETVRACYQRVSRAVNALWVAMSSQLRRPS